MEEREQTKESCWPGVACLTGGAEHAQVCPVGGGLIAVVGLLLPCMQTLTVLALLIV